MYSQDEPLVWGRAAWAGGQRYPVQWGGDPQCDWEGLAASIRGGLAWGMSGGPFYAHDIGGFAIGNPGARVVRPLGAGRHDVLRIPAFTGWASVSPGSMAMKQKRSSANGWTGATV